MMDDTPKDFFDAQAFDTGNTVFLSDVITRIKTELDGSQRRDALSAFNALKKHAGVCFATTPANAVTVRQILARLLAGTRREAAVASALNCAYCALEDTPDLPEPGTSANHPQPTGDNCR